jgi:membrane-associated phospholipid phosphatase
MDIGLLMDPGIVAVVQNLSLPVTAFFTQGEFLDSMLWYFLILSVLTFGLHPRYGVRLATAFGLNSGLNEAVKLACHLPRSYWVSEAVKAYSAHSSFGFPSGAAMSGAVMYGYIATMVRRWWVVLICIILLLATSVVRIFSGIHFVLDILGAGSSVSFCSQSSCPLCQGQRSTQPSCPDRPGLSCSSRLRRSRSSS